MSNPEFFKIASSMQKDKEKRAASESSTSSGSATEIDDHFDTASHASTATSFRDDPARARLVFDVGPPPRVPSSIGSTSISATLNGRYAGRLSLRGGIDLSGVDLNATNAIHIPAALTVQPGQLSQAVSMPQPPSSTSNETNQGKRRVVSGAAAIPTDDIEYYARAMTEPEGMTKKESDTCLTCIRGSRRCKGTQLTMVRGTKRCQTCASPGTNTSSRICYYRNPEKGVHTFEDGQRILGPSYGGRTLDKNTRAGPLERQEKAGIGAEQSVDPESDDFEEHTTETEEEEETDTDEE